MQDAIERHDVLRKPDMCIVGLRGTLLTQYGNTSAQWLRMTLVTPGYLFKISLWIQRSEYPGFAFGSTGEASETLYSMTSAREEINAGARF